MGIVQFSFLSFCFYSHDYFAFVFIGLVTEVILMFWYTKRSREKLRRPYFNIYIIIIIVGQLGLKLELKKPYM